MLSIALSIISAGVARNGGGMSIATTADGGSGPRVGMSTGLLFFLG